MIWQLMKRDPAWNWMPLTTLTVASSCVMWHFLALADAAGIAKYLFEIVFLFLMFAAPIAAMAQQSETRFQSTLPVTVRQVFLTRMISMVSLLWVPVIAGITVLTAVRDPAVSGLPLKQWLAFTSAVLVIQCVAIRGFTISQRVIVLLGFLWLFGYGERWLLEEVSATGTILLLAACWGICALIVWTTWQTIPPSFQETRIKASASPAQPGKDAQAGNRSALSWKTPLLTIARMQGLLRVLAPLGVMIMGGTATAFWLALVAFQWPAFRTQFRWMFALPVPPRTLIIAAMLPTLLALCGGYEVSIRLPWLPIPSLRGVSVRHSQSPFDSDLLARQNAECDRLNVLPSPEYWVPVRRDKTTLIQAPWGETFQPSTYRESGFDVYNPYAVGCENSQHFLEWQVERATVAIYGRPIPLDKGVDTHVEQMPITGLRTQLINLAGFAGLSMLSMLIWMANDWYRVRRLPQLVRVALISVTGLSAAGVFVLVALRKLDVMQWLSWTLPGSLAGTIAVIVAALALLYLAVDKFFRQLEFVDKPATGRPA